MNYPKTKMKPEKIKFNTHNIIDNFLWLHQLDDPETESWIQSQHQFTESHFNKDQLEQRKAKLRSETQPLNIRSLKHQHDNYVGVIDDPIVGQQAFISRDLKEFTVLQKQGDPYTTLFSCEFSPADENIYIFSGYYKNETRVSINLVKDDHVVARFGSGFDYSFTKDGKYIYYAKAIVDPKDTKQSIHEIYRFNVEEEKEELLYTYSDNAVVIYFKEVKDGMLVMIDKNYHDTKLVFIDFDLNVQHITDVLPHALKCIGHIDNDVYFVTDEQDDIYKIMTFDIHEGYASRKILDGPKGHDLNATILNEKLVVFSKEDAEDIGKIYSKEGVFLNELTLPSDFSSVYVIGESHDALYLNYESVFIPPCIIKHDGRTFEIIKELTGEPKVDDLKVEKHNVSLRDGQSSTLYVIYKDKPNENSPLIIYGYGGYGASQSLGYYEPMTHYTLSEWCDLGGIFVNVILRGGGEYGKAWHDAGKLDKKQNTFNDLYDMTQYLHDNRISSPSKTVVGGASNGGLLVSAAYTQRPDLFACVIDGIGLHDMLHYIKDPRGSMYKTEYGDPEDEAMFEVLRSYSPYHNLKENTEYPAIYIHVGKLDTNVPPYHGMKFAAKAQTLNPSGNPILLRVLEKGHHDFGRGEERITTLAERQCFIENILNINQQEGGNT